MKLLAFDLEIARHVNPEGKFEYSPEMGVSIAATATNTGTRILWYSVTPEGTPAPEMDLQTAESMFSYLGDCVSAGFLLVTWNGLSFDLRLLGDVYYGLDFTAHLALGHCDLMFQVVCTKGHYLGLDKAASGMGVIGKLKETTGGEAPVLWQAGRWGEVMRYVARDAAVTLAVAEALMERKRLRWISGSGSICFCEFPKLLTVDECLKLELPDTSWMTNLVLREHYYGWIRDLTPLKGGPNARAESESVAR